MDWFGLSPSVVHIISLAVGLGITGLVAAITWQYRQPSAQARHRRRPADPAAPTDLEAEVAIRRELRTQVALLMRLLGELPPADSSRLTEAILNGDDLSDFSFTRFRTLASEIDGTTDIAAAQIETNMKWLGALMREIRSKRSGLHYDWNSFPRRRYNDMIKLTRRPLQELARHLEESERAAGQSSSSRADAARS